MDEAFIGSIILFAGNFAPRNWAFCQGQLLSIAQNPALYSILGTTYGGNGTTTFALPDLRGRVPVGTGHGPGLENMALGQMGGQSNVTLLGTEIPAHTHTLVGSNASATTDNPEHNFIARWNGNIDGGEHVAGNAFATSPNTTLSPLSIGSTGGSQPHNNMQPYLGLNYIICLYGIYPPRD